MNSNYPYLEFIKIAKECRVDLINDTLDSNSPDLYNALYSNSKNKICLIKLELYEIEWLELHWKKITETIENKVHTPKEQKELISMFIKWYKIFVDNWGYTEFDIGIFEEKKNILKFIILVNNKWEKNLKEMKVFFERSKKILNEKISTLEKEEN